MGMLLDMRACPFGGHCSYVPLVHERRGINLLQNFFCCEKTSLPNMKLDADVHWFLIFTKRFGGQKEKICSKLDIQTFRSWKMCFCEYSSTSKSLSKNSYNSTY